MEHPAKTLGRAALLGGLGGGLNAFWCLAKFPVAVSGGTDFLWTIVPAGACHGALLTVLTVGIARAMHWRPAIQRWIGVPLVGWLAGWLSFIPISLYMQSLTSNSIDPGLSAREIVRALWPFEWSVGSLWSPYASFGLVAALYDFLLVVLRQLRSPRLSRHLLMGGISGALGSLWWWCIYKPWYLSLLHGAVWGTLVGFGVWKSHRVHPSS